MSNDPLQGRKKLLRTRAIRQRYDGISSKTVDRWTASGVLPQPLLINGVRFWDQDELEQLERQRISAASNTPDA
jgi:predicted DNA-binding transcriptional regulator AlpA